MPFMLPTIISNFFSGPATRKYPAVDRVPPEHARGHIVFDESKCVFCGNCARRCPAVAIEVKVKEKLLYFHPGRCIVCEVCVEACPKNAISLESRWRKTLHGKGSGGAQGKSGGKAGQD
ncbi:MAG: 4Fe-4S binding protein [Candidatus Xenobiia bacterium LiM19]